MTQRLKSLISELYLYRSGESGRRVFTASRAEAERLPALPSMAMISITAAESPPANLNNFDQLLRLSFADVDHLSPELSARGRGKVAQAFTIEQATQILDFVDELPRTVTTIIVHCEGGFSRSCGVAQGLHELFGYDVEFERLMKANQSVVKLLRAAKPKG